MRAWISKQILLFLLPGILLLGGCAMHESSLQPTPVPAESVSTADTSVSDSVVSSADETPLLTITEVMPRNHATLRDPDGEFSDWVEIRNDSGVDVNLSGWRLSDRRSRDGLVFPPFLLPADTTFVVYASGKDRPEELHTPFSLSAGESLYLCSPDGSTVSELVCPDLSADRSWALQEDGSWEECLYPTPWRENSTAAYDAWQNESVCSSPLIISEVAVSDPNGSYSPDFGGSDWVELKNVSSSPISLSGWYLSDNPDNLKKTVLPARTLDPGALTVIRCDRLGLKLNSENEALFLSEEESGLQDWLVLRDIPLGGSFGRMAGRNGGFFFASVSPGRENADGYRRVSAAPKALTPDGVFDGSETVLLDLKAAGTIYYTVDGSVPTLSSQTFSGLASVPVSCTVRALAAEPGALPSRVLTLNYFIGENFSLPVVSLVSDNKTAFRYMLKERLKGQEWSGSFSFYDDGGSFTMPCGIGLHGDTSLTLRKKGLSLKFRGSYGAKELNYDLFGGGVTHFTDLILRGGQDQEDAVIRNELCENLALSASDHVIASRSRYCVVYIDGVYSGIYALSEKFNEQLYADLAQVGENSVTTVDSEAPRDSELYQDVFLYCARHDMADPENYAHFCSLMDVDSLIDWVFLEGFFANTDITYGNLRFCRTSEGDGLWRLMFYDLDAALREPSLNHAILLKRNNIQCVQVTALFADLMANPEFRDRFLRRSAELLNGPLSDEAVLAEIDRLAEIVAPEIRRDFAMEKRSYAQWEASVNKLRSFIIDNNWHQHNIDAICRELHLSAEEREQYFGAAAIKR